MMMSYQISRTITLMLLLCIFHVNKTTGLEELQTEIRQMKNILSNLLSKYELELKKVVSELESTRAQIATLATRVEQLEDKSSRRYKHDVSENLSGISPLTALRTCAEFQALGLTGRGIYYLDPDGPGDLRPLPLRCIDGKTIITHETPETNLPPCEEPGCHARRFTYNLPRAYIQRIKALSTDCEQQISIHSHNYDMTNESYPTSWWTDASDNTHSQWFSNDESMALEDYGGILRNRSRLPVKKVNFIGLRKKNSSMTYKIGPLICRGKASPSSSEPESCMDLWLRGVQSPGYYPVKKSGSNPILLFCDMSKEPGEMGFERNYGTLGDLRSFVAFDVTLRRPFMDDFRIVNFTSSIINSGGHFNLLDGTFIAPLGGTYLLSVHGLPIPKSPFSLQIQVNQAPIAVISNGKSGESSVGTSVLWRLTEGDEVRLYNFGGDIHGEYNPRESQNLHFIGFLIHSG